MMDPRQLKFNRISRFGPKDIVIRDITLREGEQVADVAFSENEKIQIAESLSDAGVPQIQCGYASSAADTNVVKALKSQGCKASLELMVVGYSRNWHNEVSAAFESGADITHFIFRSDDLHLAELNLTHLQARERVREIASYAKACGAKQISFGPSFASRANPKFLVSLVNSAILGGARYTVISDSTGVMNPEGFGALVKYVQERCNVTIAVHCHDDFGLALANSVQGIRSGAKIIESSLGGFGERAGNVATEEVVMVLNLLYGRRLRIDGKKLADSTRLVFKLSHMEIPALKPIVGENTFTQKIDIHVMTTKTKPWLHEPFDPKIVGSKRRLVIGKGSGPIAIVEKARELSLQISEEHLKDIVREANQFAEKRKRALTDGEFRRIVSEMEGGPTR